MYTGSMAFKKIIHNAFEQVLETSKDIAKSSTKQIVDTLSPWDMIRNSFNENTPDQVKSKEIQNKGKNSTDLNFKKLTESYETQDKQKIESMKQKLFQMVKRDDERSVQRVQQTKGEKERATSQEAGDKQRQQDYQKRQSSLAAPQGKLKGRKRKATEPQPAETKPGGGKQ